jgi:dihydrofolate reductase
MGKLIYLLNVSADGFIARPDGELDWPAVDDELHSWFNEHARGMEASLYGRRMYELMSGYWPTAEADPDITDTEREFARIWNRVPKVVFSSTLESVGPNARLVNGDVGEILADLRREMDGDLEVSGANLAGQFVRRGLVDEFQLVIHPVILGSGRPYWPELDSSVRLRTLATHTFTSGVHLISYGRA